MKKVLLASALAALLPLVWPIARNFEYEYASLNAYLALALLPLFALSLGSWLPTSRWPLAVIAVFALNYALGFAAFHSLACPCSAGEFSSFWLLQTAPHLMLGLGIGSFIHRYRQLGHSRRRLLLVFGCGMLLLGLQLAATLWFYPQKRSTHLLAGFLHGAIYDNWIPLDPGIAWTRLAQGLLAAGWLAFAQSKTALQRQVLCSLLLVSSLACYWRGHAWPSQQHGIQALLEKMPEVRTGSGFIMHSPATAADPALKARIDELYRSAAFHVQDLMGLLDVANPAVHIFVYPNRESKKLWFGGDGTDITDVVTPSVHITPEGWPHPTLRHELVHAIASRFAYHGLGFHPNMAFTEGLAVALAPTEDDLSLHEGAADILANKRLLHIEHLFSPLFWSESGRRAYTAAGSLLLFLLSEGSLSQVKALYAGASWESALGQSPDAVLRSWQTFLHEHYPQRALSLEAEALFRYPGLLQDLCPHSKATLAKSGPSFGLEARQPKGWIASRDYWPWRYSLDKDPAVLASLLRQRFTATDPAFPTEGFDQELQSYLHIPPKIQEDVDIFLLHIDSLIRLQQNAKALQEIDLYLQRIKGLRLSDQILRQIWVRRQILRDVPPRSAKPLAQANGWIGSRHPAAKAPRDQLDRGLSLAAKSQLQ